MEAIFVPVLLNSCESLTNHPGGLLHSDGGIFVGPYLHLHSSC